MVYGKSTKPLGLSRRNPSVTSRDSISEFESECEACRCKCRRRFVEEDAGAAAKSSCVQPPAFFGAVIALILLFGVYVHIYLDIPRYYQVWTDYREVAPPLGIPTNDTACGKSYTIKERGKEKETINYGDLPWQALIYSRSPFSFGPGIICEGSLISERFVLTTALCASYWGPSEVSDIVVRLGEYDSQNTNEPYKHENFAVKSMTIHEKYETEGDTNDIALLELAESVVFKEAIAPICLPGNDALTLGQIATNSGWDTPGRRSKMKRRTFDDLAKFDVRLEDCKKMDLCCKCCCPNAAPDVPVIIDDSSSLCGVPLKVCEAWKGLVGGPLFLYRDGRAELIGITAAFNNESKFHIIYTNVAAHSSWITTNMNNPR